MDVGEVGGELEAQYRVHLALRTVLDRDRLLEPAPDEQIAAHGEPGRGAQLEMRDMRRRLLERDGLAALAVDRQNEA